jgi:hypothetical protein
VARCWAWDCPDPDAPADSPVVWRCPDGHRSELWYCRACAGPYLEWHLRSSELSGGAWGLVCPGCSPAWVYMMPVTEGVP